MVAMVEGSPIGGGGEWDYQLVTMVIVRKTTSYLCRGGCEAASLHRQYAAGGISRRKKTISRCMKGQATPTPQKSYRIQDEREKMLSRSSEVICIPANVTEELYAVRIIVREPSL